MPSTWLLAHPSPGQVRAGDPLADPAFHFAMAPRSSGRTILLGERVARSRGSGGRTVTGAWADSGAAVIVIAETDPRHQSGDRLLVDGDLAVEHWARSIRGLGATGACWHTDVESPAHQARSIAGIATAISATGLTPMLWVTQPGSPAHGPDDLQRIGVLLESAAAEGADLAGLTVCLGVDPSAPTWRGHLGALVADLRTALPATLAQVLVVAPRERLHLAQGDAYDLFHAVEQESPPWPVAHCAGDLALRQVAGWWREPGLARRAGNRFETILGQLSRPTGPVYARRHEPTPQVPAPNGPARSRRPRTFDTSLFRKRSLYRSRTQESGS